MKKIINLIILIYFCLGLSNCAKNIYLFKDFKDKKKLTRAPVIAKYSWFKMPIRFVEDRDKIHPFFDLNPFWNFSQKKVSFFIQNYIGDKTLKKLNIQSGELYTDKIMCLRKAINIYDNYRPFYFKNEIEFVNGIIPRTLNSLNNPLEIFVIGNKKYFYHKKNIVTHKYTVISQKARIVAGLILQECQDDTCFLTQKWQRREILIGVNPFDKRYKSIIDLKTLKSFDSGKLKIKLKEYILSLFGTVKIQGEIKPIVNITKFIKSSFIIENLKNKKLIFDYARMSVLKKGCLLLYDYVWNEFAQLRDKKEIIKNFAFYFETIQNKFHSKLQTCFHYVPFANIKENHERYWFFTFLHGASLLRKLGINFSCRTNNWDIHRIRKKSNFNSCTLLQINKAVRDVRTIMNLQKKEQSFYYRYISYDNFGLGTHNEINSWVFDNGKRYQCSNPLYEKRIFPDNIPPIDLIKKIKE